jgi:hypothetical protein
VGVDAKNLAEVVYLLHRSGSSVTVNSLSWSYEMSFHRRQLVWVGQATVSWSDSRITAFCLNKEPRDVRQLTIWKGEGPVAPRSDTG